MPRTLLAVHAHPDDESSKGAATMARYADQGVRVVVVTCTGGEAGEILNPAMDKPGVLEQMPELRRQELAKALEVLNVTAHHWLGYRDSGMPDSETNGHPDAFASADLEEATGRLVALIRAERPQVVLTYDERGGYPHPDHIRCHEVSVAAFEAAGDAERYPDAGEPWQPLKLYYSHNWNRPKMMAIHEAMLEHGLESPYADRLEEWKPDPEWDARVTTRIPCGDYFGVRDQALLAHATQIDPDGPWFVIPREIQQKVWGTEDYELVTSHVESEIPEDDLFAGVTPEA